jgi:hypothetical protein
MPRPCFCALDQNARTIGKRAHGGRRDLLHSRGRLANVTANHTSGEHVKRLTRTWLNCSTPGLAGTLGMGWWRTDKGRTDTPGRGDAGAGGRRRRGPQCRPVNSKPADGIVSYWLLTISRAVVATLRENRVRCLSEIITVLAAGGSSYLIQTKTKPISPNNVLRRCLTIDLNSRSGVALLRLDSNQQPSVNLPSVHYLAVAAPTR